MTVDQARTIRKLVTERKKLHARISDLASSYDNKRWASEISKSIRDLLPKGGGE